MDPSSINVFVPPISSFPELNPLGGGYALRDRIQVLPKAHGQRPKARPAAAGGGGATAGGFPEVLEERELHYLYVIDSQGRLLEHMRYSGDDYRAALRESFAADSSAALTSQEATVSPDQGS